MLGKNSAEGILDHDHLVLNAVEAGLEIFVRGGDVDFVAELSEGGEGELLDLVGGKGEESRTIVGR